MATPIHLSRLVDASSSLARGGARLEVAMPLLTLAGLCGRPIEALPGESRLRLRDHVIEALLWLAAHRPLAEVAVALDRAWGVMGDAPPAAPQDGVWNARLEARRRAARGDVMARLHDRVLAFSGKAPEPEGEGATAAGEGGDGDDGAAVDEPLGWQLAIEIEAGSHRTRIAADEFLGIERGVRWVGAPRDLIGIAGGRPYRAFTPLVFGDRAVRYRWIREEVLVPFGPLRIVEGG